jgi:hypothetical protein
VTDAGPPEVTVLYPASWAARPEQLAQLLGRSAGGAVIPDPSGQPADPDAMAAVGDPAFWAADPHTLADALSRFAIPDIGGGPSDDRAAGVITTGLGPSDLHGRGGGSDARHQPGVSVRGRSRGEIPSIRIGLRAVGRALERDRGEGRTGRVR